MEAKFYKFSLFGTNYDIVLTREHYRYGGLAVRAWNKVDFNGETALEPFSTFTVCLPDWGPLGEDQAWVDTNNNARIEGFLNRNELATDCCLTARSGFCEYPLYAFDLEKLPTLEELRKEFVVLL